jgi:hypothetical protein
MRFSDYSVVSVLDAPPGSPTFGLTFRDGILWVGHHSDGPTTPIRAVDPQTGDILELFDLGVADVHGLAWVGDYLWVLDNNTDVLHQVDDTGEIRGTFELPDRFWTSLVYDGTDLWISDGFTPADAFSRVIPRRPLCPPPGAVADVLFTDQDTIIWSEPSVLGGTPVVYDTVRSGDPSDFMVSTTCVEWDDGTNTTAAADEVPASGLVFHYLVRAENACPIGEGPLGSDSDDVEREGRGCP